MTGPGREERRARVALSFLADPGDRVLGAALRQMTAAELFAVTTGTGAYGDLVLSGAPADEALSRAVRKWRRRLSLLPPAARVERWHEDGLRTVIPGDPEWPSQLDDLGDARPLLLWLRGHSLDATSLTAGDPSTTAALSTNSAPAAATSGASAG